MFCFTGRHMLCFTGPMQRVLSGVLISRIQHGSRCSCRMHKYSISTILIPESYHLYATWTCTCLGSWVPRWRRQFFSTAWSRVQRAAHLSPDVTFKIKSASRRSLASSLSLGAVGAPSSQSHRKAAWQAFHVNYCMCRPEQFWMLKVAVHVIFAFS